MIFGWSNFYYLIGSAAAGLIGLTFVVVTLTAGRELERAVSLRGAGLYLTPTVVHFVTVFAISAVTMIPGAKTIWAAGAIALIAAFGLGCALRSAFGISEPGSSHWSDFWLYGGVPLAIYVGLIASAAGFWLGVPWASLALATLLLALMLVGIRNAWDTITWIAAGRAGENG